MDFSKLISAALPFIIDILKSTLTHVTPTPPTGPVPDGATAYPHEFIKTIQGFVNKALAFIDPAYPQLKVDGWAGQKTSDAITKLLAAAAAFGLK